MRRPGYKIQVFCVYLFFIYLFFLCVCRVYFFLPFDEHDNTVAIHIYAYIYTRCALRVNSFIRVKH